MLFSIGFAVTFGVGAVLLILTLPDIGYVVVAEMSGVGERIETLHAHESQQAIAEKRVRAHDVLRRERHAERCADILLESIAADHDGVRVHVLL